MGLKVYNTLTGKKEDFVPQDKNNVKMYACGITVYDACHIGHARQAIVYDIINKYLEFRGYGVTYVRNYTDVDDKIINKAREAGIDPLIYANRKIEEAEQDLGMLNIAPADISPRVSENIDIIIDFIKGLIDKGYAYSTEKGDVYFSVRKFPYYGKLSNRNIDELEHGVRKDVEELKEHPLDFALWKAEKEGEISWDSPWGKGRPGWHIECSAMSIKHLGESFDIHGGGKDLIFPHHENEIAQSEALTGKQFSKYWVHNGLITIDGQKMSKSLNNYITIKESCERYHPEVVRFCMILNHYSSNIDLSNDTIDAAEKRLYYFYKTLDKINRFVQENSYAQGVCLNLGLVDDIENSFKNAMDDDFNTALAVSNFSSVFKYANELLNKKKENVQDRAVTLKLVKEKVLKVSEPLGIFREDPEDFISKIRNKYISLKGINVDEVNNLVLSRQNAKNDKNYAKADQIRNELDQKGIIIQDIGDRAEWDIKELYIGS